VEARQRKAVALGLAQEVADAMLRVGVIRERGFARARVSDIAAAAGTSSGSSASR